MNQWSTVVHNLFQSSNHIFDIPWQLLVISMPYLCTSAFMPCPAIFCTYNTYSCWSNCCSKFITFFITEWWTHTFCCVTVQCLPLWAEYSCLSHFCWTCFDKCSASGENMRSFKPYYMILAPCALRPTKRRACPGKLLPLQPGPQKEDKGKEIWTLMKAFWVLPGPAYSSQNAAIDPWEWK